MKFWKDVLTVLTSTVTAQIISILILPILTRVVDQADIGIYFYWVSAASVFYVLATFRLDMALYIEKSEQGIASLLQVIVLITCCVSIASAIIFIFLVPLLDFGIGSRVLTRYSLPSACLIFSISLIQSFQAYLIYCRKYDRLGYFRIIQSLLLSSFLLLAATFRPVADSLVVAHCIGAGLSLVIIYKLSNLRIFEILKDVNIRHMKAVLIEHYRFPLYSMPGDFLNTFSNQLPILIIGAKYGAKPVALYALTNKIMSAPISLLAGSLMTVFRERSAAEYRQKGECTDAYNYTLKSLLTISIIPFFIGWFVIESLFTWFLGEDWRTSGQIARILLPMFFLRFLASPMSYTLYIGNWQKYDLLWQISLFIMTWGVFTYYNDLMEGIYAYAIGYGCLYVIYIIMSYMCAKGKAL